MIIVGARLKVIDNSGAKSVECIRILNKSKTKMANIGDTIVVSVKSLRKSLPKKRVSIGQVVKAIVLNKKNPKNRLSGAVVKNVKATAILIDREKETPIGTRVAVGVLNEIRERGLIKILTLARGLI